MADTRADSVRQGPGGSGAVGDGGIVAFLVRSSLERLWLISFPKRILGKNDGGWLLASAIFSPLRASIRE